MYGNMVLLFEANNHLMESVASPLLQLAYHVKCVSFYDGSRALYLLSPLLKYP